MIFMRSIKSSRCRLLENYLKNCRKAKVLTFLGVMIMRLLITATVKAAGNSFRC